ncbi:MAG: ABC transporter ATP-binding protein [Halobacteriales archaeon]
MLAVESLSAGYTETTVLNGVSLDVSDGEIVALVGRNGAGKTTTLRTITGALTPSHGTVTFRGEEITGLPPMQTARLGIGLVPEERRIFPGLTVEENLRIAGYGAAKGGGGRSIEAVLDDFENLRERRTSLGHNLSGGEQQMLAIGRALINGADLLLLDESTEGLAPMIVQRVQELIRELNTEGLTVLMVEQNLAVVMDVADRIYVLDKGEIVYEGTPAELKDQPEIRDRHLGVSV